MVIINGDIKRFLDNIKITQETNLPYLESFREFYNDDEYCMSLLWYIWFLNYKFKQYRKVVKEKWYTGSFSQFLDGK